jgi:hypothetical protein
MWPLRGAVATRPVQRSWPGVVGRYVRSLRELLLHRSTNLHGVSYFVVGVVGLLSKVDV